MSEKQTAHEKLMAAALAEMEDQPPGDPTARTMVYRADVGRSTVNGQTTARINGISTSPKIAFHDVPWEQLRNAHPELESEDTETLLELCYGMSVYEASRTNFASFNRETLRELLDLSPLEVEELLEEIYEEDEEDEDE